MPTDLSKIRSANAVQDALDEFEQLGRASFLSKYGFGKSRTYFVVNPNTGNHCDSKAIAGVARHYQNPDLPPLRPEDFSGGEATVAAMLQRLGFEIVRLGEDWSDEEVRETVGSYFRMLRHEALGEPYKKSEFNAELREKLNGRSKAAVELKHQNISAILQDINLPFIDGYKPRGNAQLLLRQSVQRFLLENGGALQSIVDALESVKQPDQLTFRAKPVAAPLVEAVAVGATAVPKVRVARKVDYADRDERNRDLGRAGEHWCISYEHQRLADAEHLELIEKVDWVADRLGDGLGYDIESMTEPDSKRFIEVKTTNGGLRSSFIVTQNELDVSQELGDSFFLYRLFDFRSAPQHYELQGDIRKWVHLEALDYRATFRKMTA